MSPLDLVTLPALMDLTSGRPDIVVGFIDGPLAVHHPDLAGAQIRMMPGKLAGACTHSRSAACLHGTFVAGILCAQRGSAAPAICPNCTLLVRPIFAETTAASEQMPSATPEELAEAIVECIKAGAHVLNVSSALVEPSSRGQRALVEALDYTLRRGVLVVVAAGNQGTLGSSVLTRHPWVIPVVACDLQGRPMPYANLGHAIGRRGLRASGDGITSLSATGESRTFSGTSVAVPFVTGTIALVWSAYPTATAAAVRGAITGVHAQRRTTVVPPLLDAWAAYQVLQSAH